MPVRIDEVSANLEGDQPLQGAQPGMASEAAQAEATPGSLAQQDELRRLWRKIEQRKARIKAD